jgi:hypothetical protein
MHSFAAGVDSVLDSSPGSCLKSQSTEAEASRTIIGYRAELFLEPRLLALDLRF